MGMGTPNNQSKMKPVAAVSFIPSLILISVSLSFFSSKRKHFLRVFRVNFHA